MHNKYLAWFWEGTEHPKGLRGFALKMQKTDQIPEMFSKAISTTPFKKACLKA